MTTQEMIQVLTDNETARLYRAFPLNRSNGSNETKLSEYRYFLETATKRKLKKEFESVMACSI